MCTERYNKDSSFNPDPLATDVRWTGLAAACRKIMQSKTTRGLLCKNTLSSIGNVYAYNHSRLLKPLFNDGKYPKSQTNVFIVPLLTYNRQTERS